MLKRLLVGLVLGAILGGALGAALVFGLGMTTFAAGALGTGSAYLAAAAAGVLTGLVAGKPIWSADGKIEAGLKAFFGALLAAGAMFAVRRFAAVDLDLGALRAGHDLVGNLPLIALPLIASLLGAFFELDNTGPTAGDGEKKLAGASARVRVGAEAAAEDDVDDFETAKPKKQRR